MKEDFTDCLSKDDIAAIQVGISPPALGSIEDKADLDEVIAQQERRTDAACARALSERDIGTKNFFFGPKLLSSAQVEEVDFFLTRSFKAMDPAVWGLKDAFNRIRPHIRDPKNVHPCPPVDTTYNPGGSFPSGHAAISYLEALILGDLYPDRKDVFINRAKEIGNDRVVLGVHHPLDVRAGQMIARRTYDVLRSCPKFMTRFHAIQVTLEGTSY